MGLPKIIISLDFQKEGSISEPAAIPTGSFDVRAGYLKLIRDSRFELIQIRLNHAGPSNLLLLLLLKKT